MSSRPPPQSLLGASPRLFERLYDILKRRIAGGGLAPGTRLLEIHLAHEFGVAADPFLAEHLEVVRRLEEGRVVEAARALERHLEVSVDRAVGRIAFIVRHRAPEPLSYLTVLPEEP